MDTNLIIGGESGCNRIKSVDYLQRENHVEEEVCLVANRTLSDRTESQLHDRYLKDPESRALYFHNKQSPSNYTQVNNLGVNWYRTLKV